MDMIRKLNSRQMIILGVTLAVVLYGAYAFFSTGRRNVTGVNTVKRVSDLNTFMGEINTALTQNISSSVDAYMIKMADADWLRNPFYEPRDDREDAIAREAARVQRIQEAMTAVKGKINYTGYVDMGHKKIAIINGNEYVIGNVLDVADYVLNDIHPTKIVIYNKGTRLTIDIPLQE